MACCCSFNGSTVWSQQHGDRFLQELAELCEPLRADRAVHHPVITAKCHRHHAGYVKPAKAKHTLYKILVLNLLYVQAEIVLQPQYWPFFIISRQQPFLWATNSEDTGLRRIDYRWEVFDAKHPQIRDGKCTSLVEKHVEEECFSLLIH